MKQIKLELLVEVFLWLIFKSWPQIAQILHFLQLSAENLPFCLVISARRRISNSHNHVAHKEEPQNFICEEDGIHRWRVDKTAQLLAQGGFLDQRVDIESERHVHTRESPEVQTLTVQKRNVQSRGCTCLAFKALQPFQSNYMKRQDYQ